MTLYEICEEIGQIEEGLMYGQIAFEYDKLMCAMKPGHPAELLDDILSYIGWDVFSGKAVPLSKVEETCEDLKSFRSTLKIKELSKPIKDLEKYIAENKRDSTSGGNEMKKYLIEDVKCAISAGGFACGPISGNPIVSIRFKDGDETRWLSLVEVEGIPNCFLTEEDIHEKLISEDFDDEFTDYLDQHSVGEFNGITFGEYTDIYYSISQNSENPAIPLIRYLLTLARCDTADEKKLIEMSKGKYADELEIPMSDIEEDYLAELEEEG